MKSKRRRRYKKKKYDLFLIFKIALICYLVIFGIGYMSSNTSAYLSSQSEVPQTITAGIWEVPQVFVNACGQEYTVDEVTGEIIYLDLETKDDSPIEESEKNVILTNENEINGDDKDANPTDESEREIISIGEEVIDSVDKDANPTEESEEDVILTDENEIEQEDKGATPTEESEKAEISSGEEVIDCMDMDGSVIGVELGCEGEDGSLVGENESASSEGIMADCNNNDEPIVESEIEVPENIEIIDQINEEQNEIEDGDSKGKKESDTKTEVDDSKEEQQQKPNEESGKQPDGKDESETESEEKNPTEKDSTKDEAPENSTNQNKANEINEAVKQEDNILKAEGDTNEIQ